MSSGARRTRATASLEKVAKEAVETVIQSHPFFRNPLAFIRETEDAQGTKNNSVEPETSSNGTESSGSEEEPIEVAGEPANELAEPPELPPYPTWPPLPPPGPAVVGPVGNPSPVTAPMATGGSPFALTLGQANSGVINFTSKTGTALYKASTQKLDEELYDCTPDGFFQFMQCLQVRAAKFGWSKPDGGILNIPVNPRDASSPAKSLLTKYGVIDMETISEHELTYIHKPVRAAQDNRMLYQCLINSLSKQGKEKVTVWSSQYIIGPHSLLWGAASSSSSLGSHALTPMQLQP